MTGNGRKPVGTSLLGRHRFFLLRFSILKHDFSVQTQVSYLTAIPPLGVASHRIHSTGSTLSSSAHQFDSQAVRLFVPGSIRGCPCAGEERTKKKRPFQLNRMMENHCGQNNVLRSTTTHWFSFFFFLSFVDRRSAFEMMFFACNKRACKGAKRYTVCIPVRCRSAR